MRHTDVESFWSGTMTNCRQCQAHRVPCQLSAPSERPLIAGKEDFFWRTDAPGGWVRPVSDQGKRRIVGRLNASTRTGATRTCSSLTCRSQRHRKLLPGKGLDPDYYWKKIPPLRAGSTDVTSRPGGTRSWMERTQHRQRTKCKVPFSFTNSRTARWFYQG